MAEGRPPISSSRVATGDIAQHSFSVVRRGFDSDEVRSYLQSVSRSLEALEEREEELRAALAEAEGRAAHPVVDELQARTEASSAERVVEVELLVANAQQEARVESERVTAEALAEGEAIITRAKDEGRALLEQVQEARR